MKIHFSIAKNKKAKLVSNNLLKLYGQEEVSKAEVIVAVGGDGAMLAAMRESILYDIPVFGLNRGNIGFLMNEYNNSNLIDRLKEANEIVEKIDTLDAIKKHGSDETIFIDVRDSGDIQKTGTIKDALTIPRGFIEFAADDQTPYFNTKLNKNSEIILVCGAGGQAALSGKTLIEMGYSNVKNVGGIGDWEKNNGPMDK